MKTISLDSSFTKGSYVPEIFPNICDIFRIYYLFIIIISTTTTNDRYKAGVIGHQLGIIVIGNNYKHFVRCYSKNVTFTAALEEGTIILPLKNEETEP